MSATIPLFTASVMSDITPEQRVKWVTDRLAHLDRLEAQGKITEAQYASLHLVGRSCVAALEEPEDTRSARVELAEVRSVLVALVAHMGGAHTIDYDVLRAMVEREVLKA